MKVFRKALFIDQGVMINPDHKEGQETNINKEKYYKSIYDFLKKLKKNLNTKLKFLAIQKLPKKLYKDFFQNKNTKK